MTLLPTPQATNNENRQSEGYGPNLGAALSLLPTPNTMDHLPAREGEALEKARRRGDMSRSPSTVQNLRERVVDELLPTPLALWGQYEAAITRWEKALGRKAPTPTEPRPRDGKPQLSARFVEWMMGLPDGWVTDPELGLSRTQQIKMLGNGVVPQQALLALQIMLGGGPDDAGA